MNNQKTNRESGIYTAAKVKATAWASYAAALNDLKEKSVLFRIGGRYAVLVRQRVAPHLWNLSNGNGTGTQYDLTTQEAADVLALCFDEEQKNPLKYESVTRTAEGYDKTADGLEFRAVVVGCDSLEIEHAFLTLEEAQAAGFYGYQLEPDPAEWCKGSDGYRGGRLLVECCKEEDAGGLRIAYGDTYEQAAERYRAGAFGIAEAINGGTIYK